MTKMNVKTKSFRGGKTTDYIRFRRRFRKVNAAVNRYRIRKFIYVRSYRAVSRQLFWIFSFAFIFFIVLKIIMSITTMRYVDMTVQIQK
ncbi:hypothetical protein RclHR1_01310002 [Rhizophagus clarus]|uniref:Uncharacterized protein n=1 Tax=Rhizophagus clarus TaxID=94130 RepID=A0A2Z6R1V6_9GLOM|nr:hypothetical protein RclHR1_01310002 [Rhizophagus clarus]